MVRRYKPGYNIMRTYLRQLIVLLRIEDQFIYEGISYDFSGEDYCAYVMTAEGKPVYFGFILAPPRE